MTSKNERGCWLRERCYKCGHRLALASTACPQCGEEFHGRDIKRYPDTCECDRCTMARDDQWQPVKTAPEGEEVLTKIHDAQGVRNEQPMTRHGRLWFLRDGMYVYYTPTHWRREVSR